jgi:hypothetical protein
MAAMETARQMEDVTFRPLLTAHTSKATKSKLHLEEDVSSYVTHLQEKENKKQVSAHSGNVQ